MYNKRTMELAHKTVAALPVPAGEVERLYENSFPAVARFVSKMGGSLDDAKDIFHDTLVIYLEQRREINGKAEAYLVGIAKHLWLRKFKKDLQKISFTSYELTISIPEDYFPDVDSLALLRVLKNTGRKCMDLLHSFYYGGSSVSSLAAEFGYRNEHSVSVQKFKCIEKIRDFIKSKSLRYEDFLE
jgi:DNA-directed RNA polymerase specialized sigma24 family protein